MPMVLRGWTKRFAKRSTAKQEAKLIALRLGKPPAGFGRWTLHLFFAEPLSGFRQATARPHRTKQDWAIEVANLLDTRYSTCKVVTLVCDNLNTHTMGAFYEAFTAEKAREYVRKINFVYTPKHGSWLNVAECELSCMTSQCLAGRRIGELNELQAEIKAWADKTNLKQRGVDWQFKINDARTKLTRLYPKIKM